MKHSAISDNELIAEFMGLKKCDCGVCQKSPSPMWKHGSADHAIMLRYHDSWDWLMPVVEKIDGMMPPIRMPEDLEALKAGTHGSEKYMDVSSMPMATPISEAYGTVVQFIKWYKHEKS